MHSHSDTCIALQDKLADGVVDRRQIGLGESGACPEFRRTALGSNSHPTFQHWEVGRNLVRQA